MTVSLNNNSELMLPEIQTWFNKVINGYNSSEFPHRKEENWRRFPKDALDELSGLSWNEKNTSMIEISILSSVSEDISFLKINEIVNTPYLDWFMKRSEALIDNQENKKLILQALKNVEDIRFLILKKNITTEAEIRLRWNNIESANSTSLAIFILQEEASSLKLNLVQEYGEMSSGYYNLMTFCDLKKNSVLEIFSTDRKDPKSNGLSNRFFHLGENAGLKEFQLSHGGQSSKSSGFYFLEGQFSTVHSRGVSLNFQENYQEVNAFVNHEADDTKSDILLRTALQNGAHHVFSGDLHVGSEVRNAKAAQLNQNILLDTISRAQSMPRLSVFSENVECSHGSASGDISEEELYYLETRGIPENDGKKLLLEGFLGEMVGSFPDGDFKNRILSQMNVLLEEMVTKRGNHGV